jgi:serine/threonine-protein kinase RsbW
MHPAHASPQLFGRRPVPQTDPLAALGLPIPLMRCTLSSAFAEVEDATDRLLDPCRSVIRDPERCRAVLEDLRMGLVEALNNCIEHAYDMAGGWPIVLGLWHLDGGLVLCVCDRGRPLPPALLDATAPSGQPAAPDTLPDGGWGWMMLRTAVDSISYRRTAGWNVLILEKWL